MPAGIPAVPPRSPEERIAELLMANSNEVSRRRWIEAKRQALMTEVQWSRDRFTRLFAVLARHDEGAIDRVEAVKAFRLILEGEGP